MSSSKVGNGAIGIYEDIKTAADPLQDFFRVEKCSSYCECGGGGGVLVCLISGIGQGSPTSVANLMRVGG